MFSSPTGRTLTATLCCVGVILWTLPAGIISAGLTSIDEKRRELESLRRPAARLILAWWRLQTIHRQSRTVFGNDHEKAKCKEFVARLLYMRLLREFQRCQNGVNNEYGVQIRKDMDRILRNLQKINEKLNNIDQKFLR